SYALMAPRLARRVEVHLVYSFERTFRQDLYRAGEGCHRQWLALRRQYLPRPLCTLDSIRPFHAVVLAIERQICQGNGAKVLVATSQMVKEDFLRQYVPLRVATALVRNGVDLSLFHPDVRIATRDAAREALGLAPDQLVLLSVGSGYLTKGVPTVLRALGHLRRRSPLRLIFLIAGKGNPTALRNLARREGVRCQVRLLGFVEDAIPLYAAADLFVLPSLYDTASNATLEALGMGLPVITTTTNGSSEIVEHDRSGWLLETPADYRGLAAMIEAAADPAIRRTVGLAGRKAVEPWTWLRHFKETLALCSGFLHV
ncbi:MAG: glycosyltransferase family 4 protein, partial [Nitrospiraceae bacterium]